LTEISRVLELCFTSLMNDKDEIEPALLNFLEVCQIPFSKLRSSDETNYVPLLSVFFNALCPLLRIDGQNSNINYDKICASVGELIICLAWNGVQIIWENASGDNEPMEDLYSHGTWNLIGISKSDVPETLVGLLAENKKCKEVLEVIIETIACCSLYWPIANKFASMGVLKDLVLFIGENKDFWTSFV